MAEDPAAAESASQESDEQGDESMMDIAAAEDEEMDETTAESSKDATETAADGEDVVTATTGNVLKTTKNEAAEEAAAEPSSKEESDRSSEVPRVEAPVYSTRGRQQKEEANHSERRGAAARDSLSDAGDELGVSVRSSDARDKPAPAAAASFLDRLGEEERRTRTRYLPDVDGIHMLFKSEIKRDMALARSVVSPAGVTSTLSSARQAKGMKRALGREEDSMDVEEEDVVAQSEDERASEIIRVGGAVRDAEDHDIAVPSNVFVAPSEDITNGAPLDGTQKQVRSPRVVESITAYNPPRPPESVGPKKKHRMLRWERRPQDIDVDLNKYRKTVQRTRQELHSVQNERQRIRRVGSILRTNFLGQLQLMEEESNQLNEELASIQMDCVTSADLLTSRTRSRGAGKGSYVMRDVLSIMKSRGAELDDNGPTFSGGEPPNCVSGVGGITADSFLDWGRHIDVPGCTIASGWSLPGENVETPYGEGVILHVYGPTLLDINDVPPADVHIKPPPLIKPKDVAMENAVEEQKDEEMPDAPRDDDVAADATPKDVPIETTNDGEATRANAPEPDSKSEETKSKDEDKGKEEKRTELVESTDKETQKTKELPFTKSLNQMLMPRVCVRLQFGVGYFPLDTVRTKDKPSTFSDSMLAARWRKMKETALSVGSCLDVAGMSGAAKSLNAVEKPAMLQEPPAEIAEEEKLDNWKHTGGDMMKTDAEDVQSPRDVGAVQRVLPFGARLLPTAVGHGNLLATAPITELEKDLNQALYDGAGVLGKHDNEGVPELTKKWEDIRQDAYTLQASVLHLRNQLYRQRQIRGFNELTYASCRDRSRRAEALVEEMRADLKSLKRRLEDEVHEMGIDEEKAAGLLTSHYKQKEKEDLGALNVSPPKRARKVVREVPPLSPKQTRRRRLENRESADQDFGEGASELAEEDEGAIDEESGGQYANENTSDEEMENQRASKRARYAQ